MKSRRKGPAANWSRPQPAPLVIIDVMTLTTLANVRAFVTRRLPKPYRDRSHWLVALDLEAAARGGDTAEASMAIKVAFLIEGVACRPNKKGGQALAYAYRGAACLPASPSSRLFAANHGRGSGFCAGDSFALLTEIRRPNPNNTIPPIQIRATAVA
jgi:hypothetical protein